MRARAAILYEIGKPAPYAGSTPLVIEDLELDPPGAGKVLVELVGARLRHSDLSTIDGSRPRPVPMAMGHEASGVVREVGPGVTGLKADDHVVSSYVPMCGRCLCYSTGRPALCEAGAVSNAAGTLLGGGVRFHKGSARVLHHMGVSAFSQFTVAAQESLIRIDRSVPMQTAALFGCAALTGVGAVTNTAKVGPGQPVAVFGLGGVGLSVVMGARLAGAFPIIAVDTLPAKFALARKLGAHHTIDPKAVDVVSAITDLTGDGVEFTFEAVGSAAVLATAYDSVRRGGDRRQRRPATPGPEALDPGRLPRRPGEGDPRLVHGLGGPPARRPPADRARTEWRVARERTEQSPVRLEDINVGFDRLADGTAIRQLVEFSS